MTKTLTRRPAAALRRSLLEKLEDRQLMATTSASINFQPGGPATPAGMTADYGAAFAWQFGKQYGWNANNKANAVERQSSADNEHDTFNKLGSGAATKWEIAVDNGTYTVNIVAGDASAYDSKYVINAENTTVVNGTPTSSNRWVTGTATVSVTDGKLSLTAGSGASNVKLSSLRFTKVGSGGTTAPTTPAPTTPAKPTTPTTPTSPTTPTTPAASGQLKGTVYGTSGSFLNAGNTIAKAFDGSLSTYVDLTAQNGGSMGLDLGSAKTIAQIKFAPRSGYAYRMVGGRFEASNTANFSSGVTTLYTVTGTPKDGTLTTVNSSSSASFRYVRFVSPNNGFGNAAEIQFFGTAGTTTTPPTTPTTPTKPTVTVPAAPSTATATLASTDSIKVSWANVSNETGYVIEKSTNNSTWTEAGRVGADVTSATYGSLSYATTYYFRVKAINTAGASSTKATSSVKTGNAPVTVVKPSAPTNAAASLPSLNSVKLTWGNVSGETGYIVEKSTNNSTWTEATRVGADATSATIGSLSYTTTYYWRVKAFNSAGTSAASSTASIKTGTPTATGAGDQDDDDDQTPPPTSGDGINAFAMSGIVQNEAEFNMANKAMKELGIKSVRLWYSVNQWTDGVNNWALDKAIQYKKAGYTVTLAIVGKNVADYNTTKAYYDRLMDAPNAKYAVDYWEIGNEPNKPEYWKGSLQQFVNQQQKPAWDAIHAEGEKVIGGGVTYDVNALKQLVSYGYLNYCDYAGFHPYGENGQIVADRIKGAKAAVGNKPIIVSEWNIRLMTDMNKWASELNIAAKALSQYSYLNYYYALEVDTAVKSTGKGGVIYSDGSRNTPFWNTVYNWIH